MYLLKVAWNQVKCKTLRLLFHIFYVGEISRNYTAPCKENEEIQDCVACEATCPYIDDRVACSLLWCPKACDCKYGFIRKEEGGDCISESDCRLSQT